LRYALNSVYALSVNSEKQVLASSCLSANISAAHARRIFLKPDIGNLSENLSKTPDLVKIGKHVEHFTWRPTCVSYCRQGRSM